MKEWWQNLSSRERSWMSGLGIIICVLILYFIIWAPISHGVSGLKQAVSNNRALLSWMQQVTTVLQKNQSTDDTHQDTAADQRLAVIQTSLQDTPFNKKLMQIEQTNQNDVRVVISSVNFDDLTTWFVSLWKQNGIVVNEITLKRLNNQGLVSANIILSGRKTS